MSTAHFRWNAHFHDTELHAYCYEVFEHRAYLSRQIASIPLIAHQWRELVILIQKQEIPPGLIADRINSYVQIEDHL